MPLQSTYLVDPIARVEGTIGDADTMRDGIFRTMFNGEASAKIPFGLVVKWGSATDDRNAKILAATSDKVCGITILSQAYETGAAGELDPDTVTGGVRPGGKLNILRRGTANVKTRTGCAPGDRGFIRVIGGGTNEVVGQIENAADASDMIDASGSIEFLTFTPAGGIAKVAVDFVNK